MAGLVPWFDPTPSVAYEQFYNLAQVSPWSVVTLGGVVVGGEAQRIEGNIGQKLDVKVAPGTNGVSITDQGFQPGEFSITWRIWTPDQWQAWQVAIAPYLPSPRKSAQQTRTAVSISSPRLDLLGVSAVLLTECGTPDVDTAAKWLTITVKMLQYLTPKAVNLQPVDLPLSGLGANGSLVSGPPQPNGTGPTVPQPGRTTP
jgi:hypothetical protein